MKPSRAAVRVHQAVRPIQSDLLIACKLTDHRRRGLSLSNTQLTPGQDNLTWDFDVRTMIWARVCMYAFEMGTPTGFSRTLYSPQRGPTSTTVARHAVAGPFEPCFFPALARLWEQDDLHSTCVPEGTEAWSCLGSYRPPSDSLSCFSGFISLCL